MIGSYDYCQYDCAAGGTHGEGDEQEERTITEALSRGTGSAFFTSLTQRWTGATAPQVGVAATSSHVGDGMRPHDRCFDDFVVGDYAAFSDYDDDAIDDDHVSLTRFAQEEAAAGGQLPQNIRRLDGVASPPPPFQTPSSLPHHESLMHLRRVRRDAEQRLCHLQHARGSQLSKLHLQHMHQELRVWRLIKRSIVSTAAKRGRSIIAAAVK